MRVACGITSDTAHPVTRHYYSSRATEDVLVHRWLLRVVDNHALSTTEAFDGSSTILDHR